MTAQAHAPELQSCRRCDLWRGATQGVGGEGPAPAALMLVGEQPGDQENLAGRPFVGPAGRVLDEALASAGLIRKEIYVTNAVKHFKNEPRGRRRLHRTPDTGEITACRWWLDRERKQVRPRVIVALGATAALAVIGRAVTIGRERGHSVRLDDRTEVVVSFHPSYVLRVRDEHDRARAFDALARDLMLAKALVAEAIQRGPSA